MHNYISRLNTATCTYHIYHDNIILFRTYELSEIIFSGLFHELKTRTKYPEMFVDTISAPSRYELPSYIDSDKLTDEIRDTVSSTLVFIHTWIKENNTDLSLLCTFLLENKFDTYEQFFDSAFSIIIGSEDNPTIKDIACGLRDSVKRIYQYLGPFHGTFENIVFKTQDVLICVMMIVIYAGYIHKNSHSSNTSIINENKSS